MPRVSAIAAFVVDVPNQQNHIAHQALFQRAGNSEGCSGIDNDTVFADSKKDTDLYDMEWAFDSEGEHVALSANLNFRQVVGCQVFWPLKL